MTETNDPRPRGREEAGVGNLAGGRSDPIVPVLIGLLEVDLRGVDDPTMALYGALADAPTGASVNLIVDDRWPSFRSVDFLLRVSSITLIGPSSRAIRCWRDALDQALRRSVRERGQRD
ncbi:MAG: hypothetical protein Q4G46_12100, partial [Propionibacteriaceae bacterium]|nr:hypothetical protein [Propionibacteriaceae bacterium]